MLKVNKKQIIITASCLVLAIFVVSLGVFLVNKDNEQKRQAAVPTKEKADNLKSKAIEAIKNDDKATAKKALEDAKAQYEAVGDKDGAVDAEAQLYFVNNSNVSKDGTEQATNPDTTVDN